MIYGVATVYVLGGLIHRYIITGRPPVSNLYDTIPFITAGAVVILAIAELLTRRKVLLSLGAALGVVGLFFAASFEVGDAKDNICLLYTSPSPRDLSTSRMPSSA